MSRVPDGFTAGATTRTWFALFIVPFICVWAGGSMSGIYGRQIVSGQFNLGGFAVRHSFLIGWSILVSWRAMAVAGKVTGPGRFDQLTIFTGVGAIGSARTIPGPQCSLLNARRFKPGASLDAGPILAFVIG